ncbi:MAG: biotin/lipoyl-binding protein [Anaerolineae bacterium]|nr:biotin/lipoyl-binding protein [Anaerolineae bacterium]
MSHEFTLKLDGTTYKIRVDGNSVLVDDQPFVIGFDDDGRVLVDGIPFDINLEEDHVTAGGITYDLAVKGLVAEKAGPRRAAAAGTAAGAGAVTAIMPGKVIRLLVAEGDEVAEGDVVCILEAMKMENELKAPQAGVVKAVHVTPGQDVEMGALIVQVAAASG